MTILKIAKLIFIKTKLFFRARFCFIKRFFFRPKLPKNKNGKILLHLGCGEINSPEFINIDTRPFSHVHCIRDITNLSIFNSNYADLIYACMVLEHIPRAKLLEVLLEWKRVLKRGGVLRLTVPDFDKIVDCYNLDNNNFERIVPVLMGGQGYSYNFHFSVFNKKYLTKLLTEMGFREIREWEPDKAEYHNFSDWANEELIINDRKYFISLNIEAVK